MVGCSVLGCHNKTGGKKNVSYDEKLRFYQIPTIREREGMEARQLSEERRRLWKSVVNRKDLVSEEAWNKTVVCSRHFVNGEKAYLHKRDSPSWLPSLHLGYCPFTTSDDVVIDGYNRPKGRRKRMDKKSFENELRAELLGLPPRNTVIPEAVPSTLIDYNDSNVVQPNINNDESSENWYKECNNGIVPLAITSVAQGFANATGEVILPNEVTDSTPPPTDQVQSMFSGKACLSAENGSLAQDKLEFVSDVFVLNDPKERFNYFCNCTEEEISHSTITKEVKDAVVQTFKDSDLRPSVFNNIIQSDLDLNSICEAFVNSQKTHFQAEQQSPIIQNDPLVPNLKKAKRKLEVAEDPKIEDAFKLAKSSVSNLSQEQDACLIYGQHVGNKLLTYNRKTRTHVEDIINKILCEADLGKLDSPNTYNIQLFSTSLNSSSPISTDIPQINTTCQLPFFNSSTINPNSDQQNALPSATSYHKHSEQIDIPPPNTQVFDSTRDSDNLCVCSQRRTIYL